MTRRAGKKEKEAFRYEEHFIYFNICSDLRVPWNLLYNLYLELSGLPEPEALVELVIFRVMWAV